MAADLDRAQVYAAELAAFDGTDLEEVIDLERVVAAMIEVTVAEWWPGGDVTVKPARSDARSSSTRCGIEDGSVASITIAAPQATIATAAHELAHALAGVTHGHDARYRRAHLDVVQAITNVDRVTSRGMVHVAQLWNAYAAAELDVGDRDWPEPPTAGGAIAL
ncbi:MAG: hypothetical protein WA964_02475 [Ilumatobacter sp.]|uniref:hypothetical protein n=1 Tax=Ilumatobacter sp. TaxID=1967498 RepID=UPI003C7807DF